MSDEKISAAKIEPLASETKYGVPHDMSNRGAVGHDIDIDKARQNPLGGKGHYQHPAPHSDAHGVIGKDYDLQESKIEPLASDDSNVKIADPRDRTGLDDELIDTARIAPAGEVREEMDLP